MGWVTRIVITCIGLWFSAFQAPASEEEASAADRGRIALTSTGYLRPSWSAEAYQSVASFWGNSGIEAKGDPMEFAESFNRRYGMHPAPYPNDGLPMGLRRGNAADGSKRGIAIDCMTCHGGSIGGTSYVGLGNTQLDLKLLFQEMMQAEGKRLPPSTFVINSSRGTVNAGMFSVVLLSLRNADLSFRLFPLPLGANLPELDVPAWWLLGKKETMYYDGRTDAKAVRTNMQFMLGEKTLDEFKKLEPTFRDIQAYLKSLKPPKYPFPIDAARADLGKSIFDKACSKCHGTYGVEGTYPNRIVDLKTIGTDPARALGIAPRFVAHYNATWFGKEAAVDEIMTGYQAPPLDGVWATAPYLHNGSVPTLGTLLKSSDRPSRFYRPPSTEFEYFDQSKVGWMYTIPGDTNNDPEKVRWLFDSSRFGLGNGGHTFGDSLNDEERNNLIEYLKTL
ncbi:c-type cytochrome [Tundrisphaera lichenicola]|uniref:c-type cytochrome n=1 Tax=Tundrisphaera lichenicola TaxID=2029860 RepID=UPI003EB79D16